jgi:hypothetical protein
VIEAGVPAETMAVDMDLVEMGITEIVAEAEIG